MITRAGGPQGRRSPALAKVATGLVLHNLLRPGGILFEIGGNFEGITIRAVGSYHNFGIGARIQKSQRGGSAHTLAAQSLTRWEEGASKDETGHVFARSGNVANGVLRSRAVRRRCAACRDIANACEWHMHNPVALLLYKIIGCYYNQVLLYLPQTSHICND